MSQEPVWRRVEGMLCLRALVPRRSACRIVPDSRHATPATWAGDGTGPSCSGMMTFLMQPASQPPAAARHADTTRTGRTAESCRSPPPPPSTSTRPPPGMRGGLGPCGWRLTQLCHLRTTSLLVFCNTTWPCFHYYIILIEM